MFGLDSYIFIQINNIYNHLNIIGFDYNDDYTTKTPRKFIGFLPVLGLEITW